MKLAIRIASALGLAAGGVLLAVLALGERVDQARLDRALISYHRQKGRPTPRVEEVLNKTVDSDPDSAEGNFRKGRILHQKAARTIRQAGRTRSLKIFEEAQQHYFRSLKANPFRGAVHYWLGRVYMDMAAMIPAAEEMRLAAQVSPNQPDLLYKIGYFFYFRWKKSGNFAHLDEGLRFFREAGRLDLSYLFKSLDILREFSLHYDTLSHVIPDKEKAHYEAGVYFGFRMGFWLYALREFEQAKGIGDQEPRFPLAYGVALLHNGSLAKARENIIAGLENLNGPEREILELATHYRIAQQEEAGAKLWPELAALYPENPAPLINLGDTLHGRARRAVVDRLNTLDAECKKRLKNTPLGEREAVRKVYQKKKDRVYADKMTAVRDFYQDAAGKIPHVRFFYALADLENRLGHEAQAEHWIRKAVQTNTANPKVWIWYVNFLLAKRRFDAAVDTAKEACAKHKDHKGLSKLLDAALDAKIRNGK